jgi:hypothetical protein
MKDGIVFVYAIEAGDFIKIGVAEDPERRLRALQTASPLPLRLLDARPFRTSARAFVVEWVIHDELTCNGQLQQGEWFRRAPWDPADCLDFYHGQEVKMMNGIPITGETNA